MKFGKLVERSDIMSLLEISSKKLRFGIDTNIWWVQVNKNNFTGLLDHIFNTPAHLVIKKYIL